MNAGRHALGWLVAGSAVGLWLSLLLIFPGLQAGEWTYGRGVPIHLNGLLYGWTALPLVAWLLVIYQVPRRWAAAATWVWSAALAAACFDWLSGGSSGKVFLDWKGGALLAFVAALGFLWLVLASSWWRFRQNFPPLRRGLMAAGLGILALVPAGMWHASSPSVYPPVNPASGGPTGASLLGSTLVVVLLLLLLPRSFGLARDARSPWPKKTLAYFLVSAFVCAIAEFRGGTQHDFLQILALGLLLPWPLLLFRDWQDFEWPERTHAWRLALYVWWALLVVSGFAVFLPGVLDHLKFTQSLVAHSHLAMAGFTTSFCGLLLRLLGQRFGREGSVFIWHLAALVMVVVLALAGMGEAAGGPWMIEPPLWRTAELGLRVLCGVAMLGAALDWLLTWHTAPDHETTRTPVDLGRRRDGRRDRPAAALATGPGAAAAGDPGTGAGDLPELDRRLRGLGGGILRAGMAGWRGGRDGMALHRAGEDGGGLVPGHEGGDGSDARGLADRGGVGRGCGPGTDRGPADGLVEGPATLVLALRAAGVVATVYAHFLIFAQFAWIELMRGAGVNAGTEKLALGVMALAGIVAGFVVSKLGSGTRLLRASFAVAGISALLAPWAASMPFALGISLLTGTSIGTMTVSLAPLLPRWCGLAWLGLGTGLGYAICNLPVIFSALPTGQAWAGAAFAFAGALLVPRAKQHITAREAKPPGPGILAAVAAFTALVWLDSAAFFIIQHGADLKSGTWGHAMLWRNATTHLLAAILAGFCLRRGFRGLLVAAWIILALAGLAVNSPGTLSLAGWWYPVGVSLYSTALVAWPGFFGEGDERKVMARAAWLYAVAGWFGSANGIGMVQSLQRLPAAFVIVAGGVVLVAMLFRRGEWRAAAAAAIIVATACYYNSTTPPAADATERGRQVYIAEGCINCHSRYVRPLAEDDLRWGPASSLQEVVSARPVLIGNRRQGPDLAQVGLRRSPKWLELHFRNPRDFTQASPMPSYAHLFADSRGNDLVAFLSAADPGGYGKRKAVQAAWKPAAAGELPDPYPLFQRHCAVCHGPEAHGDGRLAPLLSRRPPNLDQGPFAWTPDGPGLPDRIARVVKFGIPGTDMPGHELLDDAQIVSLSAYVARIRMAPVQGN